MNCSLFRSKGYPIDPLDTKSHSARGSRNPTVQSLPCRTPRKSLECERCGCMSGRGPVQHACWAPSHSSVGVHQKRGITCWSWYLHLRTESITKFTESSKNTWSISWGLEPLKPTLHYVIHCTPPDR